MKTKNILFFLGFVGLLFITIISLFHSGFPITHDGQDHIARIANFYQNLSEGVWIPRWAPYLNWGYGHPILEFLYPLPSYLASFFHVIGFSFIDSTKIVFGLGMLLSGITMYMWLSQFWTKQAAFIGGLLYVFAPYRFVELYVRGDIGENLAFVFIPLVLYFIQLLSRNVRSRYVVGGSLSLGALILSHNAISLMALPFILVYIVYKWLVWTTNKSKFLLYSIFMVMLGFGISSFFWIPGLLEAKFTLRNIVTAGGYQNRFVTFSQLLYGPWSYGGTGEFTVQLGIFQWISIVISIILIPIFIIKKNKKIFFTSITLFFTAAAIFIMLPLSQFIWQRIILLQNFQFPWRFLALTVFTTAILSALIIEIVPQKMKNLIIFVVLLITIVLTKEDWYPKGYSYQPESYFTTVYNGTTDTGESAPIWSVRFMERRAKAPLQIIIGNATIMLSERKAIYHRYAVVAYEPTKFVENTLYFPGWAIFVDGTQVPIEFQNPQYRGLMTFSVPTGKHIVEIKFRETKLRITADSISILSIVILGCLYIVPLFLKKKHIQ